MGTKVFLVAAGLGLYATPAAAAFNLTIDCTGGFGPNDTVPYTVTFEETGGDRVSVDLVVVVEGPGILIQKLVEGNLTLNPNATKQKDRTLQLNGASDGIFTIRVLAEGGTFFTTDSCEFEVAN